MTYRLGSSLKNLQIYKSIKYPAVHRVVTQQVFLFTLPQFPADPETVPTGFLPVLSFVWCWPGSGSSTVPSAGIGPVTATVENYL